MAEAGNLPLGLEGRVALVTGGGSGIGQAIARQLAAAGAVAVVAGRRTDRLDATVAAIEAAGGRAQARQLDIRQSDAVDSLVEGLVEEMGRLDIAVNNAGGQFLAPILETSAKGWRTVVDLNLNGTFNVLRAAGRQMVDQGSGNILNVVTAAALRPTPGRAHSGAARSGVMSLTKSAAAEWAAAGVRVNALAPGPVATDALFAELGEEQRERFERELAKMVPLGRMGTPEEIAGLAHFLVSDAAAFVSGEVLVADGGGWRGEGLTDI